MSSYNRIILMGNLTRDPQLSYTPSQTAIVDFGVATNRKWTAQDGTQREEVCFVDCRAFGKTAENINKFFKKGKPIFVEGRLSFDQWTGQDGVKRSKHRVTVDTFTFVADGQRQEQAQAPSEPPAGENYPDSAPPRAGQVAGPPREPSIPHDDEIPF
jgi:single-strand DNA-binding protein